jgi:hypothetical protein
MVWAYGVDIMQQYITFGVEFHATHYREQYSPNLYRTAVGMFPHNTLETVFGTSIYGIHYCADTSLTQIVHDGFPDSRRARLQLENWHVPNADACIRAT